MGELREIVKNSLVPSRIGAEDLNQQTMGSWVFYEAEG